MRIYVALFFLAFGNLITNSLAQVDGRIVQGITLSTHGNGRDWGSESIRTTLESIRAVGANWMRGRGERCSTAPPT